MHRNVVVLYAYSLFHGLMFFLPVFALLLERSLESVFLVTTIMALQAIINVLLEVPSGAISDKFGRKTCIVWSGLLATVALVFLFIGGSYFMYVMYVLINSVARSIKSGADTSLLYETDPKNFKKLVGWHHALWPLGASVGSFIGGYIAVVNLELTVLCSILPFFLAFVATLFIEEPKMHRTTNTLAHHVRETVAYVMHKPQLFIMFLIALLFFASGEVTHQIDPLFFEEKGIPIHVFGFLAMVYYFLEFLGSMISYSVSKVFGERNTMYLSAIAPMVLIVLAVISGGLLAGLLLVVSSAFWGIRQPLIMNLYHREAADHNRATVVSLGNLANELGFAISAPIIGLVADFISVTQVMLVLGSLYIPVLLLIGMIHFEKKSKVLV
ncbi:MFS transporter [Candidatus Woesearchaeota archaeon]|nr:MFS transporter [Candidatus Woesearchaeota archaeon]